MTENRLHHYYHNVFFVFFCSVTPRKKKEKNVLKSIILKEKNGRPDAVEKHGVDGID